MTNKIRTELEKLNALIDIYNQADDPLKLEITKQEMLKATKNLSRYLSNIEEKV